LPAVNKWLQSGAMIILASATGFVGRHFNRTKLSSPVANAAVQKLLLLRLTDLNGKAQTLSGERGKVLVVNLWATWCPPCREGIPLLNKTQVKYAANSVEVVGIAIDNAAKVQEFASKVDIDNTVLIGGAGTLSVSRDLGNRWEALPFTLILEKTRNLAYTHAGALSETGLNAELTRMR